MEELHKTWDDIASNWHRWGPPLRPCQEDIDIVNGELHYWWRESKYTKNYIAQVLVLGVTPELVTMDFPFKNFVVGMDVAENMVKEIWPGDMPGQRLGMVGDWFDKLSHVKKSADAVLADGSFIFFNKDKRNGLSKIVHDVLKPNGVFIGRFFVKRGKDTLESISKKVKSKKIRNFHELKFRVAMALQEDSNLGVSQNDIYEAVSGMSALKENPAFSASDWRTLEFYKGKDARMYFPKEVEYVKMLSKYFETVRVVYPDYQFGEYCPIITATNPLLGV